MPPLIPFHPLPGLEKRGNKTEVWGTGGGSLEGLSSRGCPISSGRHCACHFSCQELWGWRCRGEWHRRLTPLLETWPNQRMGFFPCLHLPPSSCLSSVSKSGLQAAQGRELPFHCLKGHACGRQQRRTITFGSPRQCWAWGAGTAIMPLPAEKLCSSQNLCHQS